MAHGKVEKTNAARLLDRAKIAYDLVLTGLMKNTLQRRTWPKSWAKI